MGEDDDPAYGSDGVKNEDGGYGGTEDGDEKRSAGGETDEEMGDEEALGQDGTGPE